MQNVVQGPVGESDKERLKVEGAKSGSAATPEKCQTYAEQQDKFPVVYGDSDSEEGDDSEVIFLL